MLCGFCLLFAAGIDVVQTNQIKYLLNSTNKQNAKIE